MTDAQLSQSRSDLGTHGRQAHGVTAARLLELTSRVPAGAVPPPPLLQTAAHPLAAGQPAELACATCPVCLGVMAGVSSLLGVSFSLKETWHRPLVLLSMAAAWLSVPMEKSWLRPDRLKKI